MIIFFVSAFVFGISKYLLLPEKISILAEKAHAICLQALPQKVENLSSLQALVCGTPLPSDEFKILLGYGSLLHLFVVSGSHFIFLHQVFRFLRIPARISFMLLALYCLATLCQPPAVRAFWFLLLLFLFEGRQKFPAVMMLCLLSGLWSVLFFPHWGNSRSLLMSWLAALVLVFMNHFWGKDKKTLKAQIHIQCGLFLMMSFAVWGFSSLHPVSILYNLSLAPFISFLLFPTALLTVPLPFLARVFDVELDFLRWTLERTKELYPDFQSQNSPATFWMWVVVIFLQVFGFIYLIHRKRRRAYELQNSDSRSDMDT